VGKRDRQRRRDARSTGAPDPAVLQAPSSTYDDPEGNTLTLRGALTPATRREYADTLSGGRHQEDAWQRAIELLFERLATGWTIAGEPITKQKELLGRYRLASPDERRFVRDSLRAHLVEHFPELPAP
jgi:hypothetical protein